MRVVVADDQAIVRDGLVTLLGLMPGIEVVGAAADGQEAVELTAATDPDVVLMDLRMPRLDGVAATAAIRHAHPRTQVVVLTTYADDESVAGALSAGALGYLTKDADRHAIARALEAATSGQAVLDSGVYERLWRSGIGQAPAGDPPAGDPPAGLLPPPASSAAPPDGLTARELEVLRLIGAGLSNAEIAARLFVSETTVKTHVNHIFSKTASRDRAQAVGYAHRHGLLD
ncbi:MAG: response regulator transcription factor [Acidimicrobiales bacterium]